MNPNDNEYLFEQISQALEDMVANLIEIDLNSMESFEEANSELAKYRL